MADNWQTTTEAAEVVQKKKEERRKTTEQWSSVMFSDKSKFCYFFWKQRSQSVEEKGVNGTQMERNTASSEMWSFHNQLWFGGARSSAGVVTSASSKSSC